MSVWNNERIEMHRDNVSICTIITMFTICSVFLVSIFSFLSLAVRVFASVDLFPIVLHAGHLFHFAGIFNDMPKCYIPWLVNSTP